MWIRNLRLVSSSKQHAIWGIAQRHLATRVDDVTVNTVIEAANRQVCTYVHAWMGAACINAWMGM